MQGNMKFISSIELGTQTIQTKTMRGSGDSFVLYKLI